MYTHTHTNIYVYEVSIWRVIFAATRYNPIAVPCKRKYTARCIMSSCGVGYMPTVFLSSFRTAATVFYTFMHGNPFKLDSTFLFVIQRTKTASPVQKNANIISCGRDIQSPATWNASLITLAIIYIYSIYIYSDKVVKIRCRFLFFYSIFKRLIIFLVPVCPRK